MTPPSTIHPLQPQQARTHGWQPARDVAFAGHMNVLPALVGELGALVPHVPLAFAKLSAERYALVMLTGFADGCNQLVDDTGRWVLQVLPLELQAHPFVLQAVPGHEEGAVPQYTLGFNHASGLYRETPLEATGDQRFFTDEGQPQPRLQRVIELLQQLLVQQQLTQRAVAALHQHGLLAPWQIQPRGAHPDERLPDGLYRIDEAKLNALRGETLEALHQAHAIALAYGQLLSMSRINALQRLKDIHAARRKAAPAPLTAPPPSPSLSLDLVQKLFDPAQPDTIQFNW